MKFRSAIVFGGMILVFASGCKKVSEESNTSSEGSNDKGLGTLSFQCIVDNYTFDNRTNFKACPNGIRVAASDFEAYNKSIQIDFTCYKSPDEADQETITLIGDNGKWIGTTTEKTVDGESITFELKEKSKGLVMFEKLPLSSECSSYDYLPQANESP
ncbi:MAG: hypothetical protein HRU19_10740 [Pseudobacteriovorax sp.]|nr:hypothetical protein [Pseudobacteriovorax sp.]